MATLRRSLALAQQLVRPSSLATSPSHSAVLRSDLARLPPFPGSRASSSATPAAALHAGPVSAGADLGAAESSSTCSSSEPASAGPATTAVSNGPVGTKQPTSSKVNKGNEPQETTAGLSAKQGQGKLKKGAPKRRAKPSRYKLKKVHVARATYVESDSFLPPEWKEELDVETVNFQRDEAQKNLDKVERSELKKLKQLANVAPTSDKETQARMKERLQTVRALYGAQMAHRIIDGALMEGCELQSLVDEAKYVPHYQHPARLGLHSPSLCPVPSTWLSAYEKEHAVKFMRPYTIATLRIDVLRHAHYADRLKDEAGELILDASGKPQPGHFQSLLREDQLLWDRLVEDEGEW